HKEVFIVTLCLSTFAGCRDVGLALLRRLPPYQVARVVDFIHGRKETRRRVVTRQVREWQTKIIPKPTRHGKVRKPGKVRQWVTHLEKETVREAVGDFGLFRNVPQSLRTEVTRYLRQREADADWFDGAVLTARKALKRLYAVLHIRPGERAQQILFDDR